MSPEAEFGWAAVATILSAAAALVAVYHGAWTVVAVMGCIMVAAIVVSFRAAMRLLVAGK